MAVSWQFDHAEACGPCSLAYSLHAKKAPTHCLCRQVNSRQWSAPLASGTGATEARILPLHSRSLPSTVSVATFKAVNKVGCFFPAERPSRLKHRCNRSPSLLLDEAGCFLSLACPSRLKHRYNRSRDFFTHSNLDTFTSSCLACHVVSESFDRSHYCLEMRGPRFLSCLRWEFRN